MSDRGLNLFVKVADWKTHSDYPGDDATYSQWAWEFLRRNSEYQKDQALWEALGTAASIFDDIRSKAVPIPRIVVCEPPALLNETMAELKSRVGVARVKFYSPVEYFKRTYRTGCAPSPLRKECYPMLFEDVSAVSYSDYINPREIDGRYNRMEVKSENEILVKLRLDVPIDIQLKRIKKMVESIEEYSPYDARLHVGKFKYYLRAYDARLAGETAKNIADVLSQECVQGTKDFDEKTIGNFWKAADRLISSDYWKVAVGKSE